ncbi:MAG: hypothetical protein ACE5F2_01840 [Candidatus Paceibacteria bacterium]
MEKMDEKRKGEIALKALKFKLGKEGVKLTKGLNRELGNVSREMGVSVDELEQFFRELIQEMTDDAFAKK